MKSIKQLLGENKSLYVDEVSRKIVCRLTQHEMPMRASAVLSYVNGKRYKRFVEKMKMDFEVFNEGKNHLIPSSDEAHINKLFCELTGLIINDNPLHIEKHIYGHKFRQMMKELKDCQEKGIPFATKSQDKLKQKTGLVDALTEGNAMIVDSEDEDSRISAKQTDENVVICDDTEKIVEDTHHSEVLSGSKRSMRCLTSTNPGNAQFFNGDDSADEDFAFKKKSSLKKRKRRLND